MFRALVLTMLVFAVVAAAQEHATDAVVQTQALGGDRSAVAIASDDVNHLVLYRDVRSGGTRLFVTRVSSSGVVLDSPGPSLGDVYDGEPALTWDGNRYLAVWHPYGESLSFVVLDRTGVAVASPSGFSGTMGACVKHPRVASDLAAFVIVWEERNCNASGGERAMFARVSSAGLVVTPPTQLPGSARQTSPEVARLGALAVVTWSDSRNDVLGDIYAARIDATGALLDAQGVLIAGGAEAQASPAVGALAGNALIAWEEVRPGSGTDVYGAELTPGGLVGVAGPLASDTGAQSAPAIATFGGEAMLAFRDERGAVAKISRSRIASGPVVISNLVFDVSDAPIATGLALGCTATNCLLAHLVPAFSTMIDLELDLIAPLSAPVAKVPLLTANQQRLPSVAAGTDRFLLVWEDTRTDVSDVWGLRVGLDGNPLDAAPFLVAGGTGMQARPGAVFTGTDFLVSWVDRTTADAVRVARVPANGAVTASSGQLAGTLSNDAMLGGNQRLGFGCGTTNCLLGWTDQRIYPYRVGLTRVDFQGTPLDSLLIDPDSHALDPAVTFTGQDFLVAWVDRSVGVTVNVATVSPAGVISPPTGDLVADGGEALPSISSGGGVTLVGWQTPEYRASLGFQRPRLELPRGDVSLGPAPAPQSAPVLSFDGSRFIAAWADNRGGPPDVLYTVVSPRSRAAVSGAPRAIAAEPEAETNPAVASTSAGVTLFAWDRYVVAEGARRVFWRRVQTTSQPGAACVNDEDCASGSCAASVCAVVDGGIVGSLVLTVTAPLEGALLNRARPLVSGTASPGAVIELSVDGFPAGSIPASSAGDFQLAPDLDVSDGSHELAVAIVGSSLRVARQVRIDTVAPSAPVVLTPTESETIVTSLPGVGGTEAEQGVRIDVFIDGLLVGQDVPNGQGRWGVALLPEQTLERGPHTVLATAVDASGNTASTSVNFRVGRLLNDPPLKVGCTCTSAEPLLVFALLAPLLRRRRPGARHSATSASRSHRSRPE